jgi:hypothetical protein
MDQNRATKRRKQLEKGRMRKGKNGNEIQYHQFVSPGGEVSNDLLLEKRGETTNFLDSDIAGDQDQLHWVVDTTL